MPRSPERASLLALVDGLAPPVASRLKRWFIRWLVPFNRTLGVRVSALDADAAQFSLSMPSRRRNTNVAGTVHGAAIMALAEAVHGVAVMWHFSPGGHRMYTKEIRMRYLKPARGALRVTFRLDPAMRRDIGAALEREGACDLVLSSVVADRGGTPVARCNATYTVLRGLHGQPARTAARTTVREEAGDPGEPCGAQMRLTPGSAVASENAEQTRARDQSLPPTARR